MILALRCLDEFSLDGILCCYSRIEHIMGQKIRNALTY